MNYVSMNNQIENCFQCERNPIYIDDICRECYLDKYGETIYNEYEENLSW